jgi:[ribosomal protein S5]-alanine N-acetyltransferase
MNNNFTPFPVLETERLTLRQLTLDDDNEVFFQRSDEQMNKYVGNPPAKSIEEAREWIDKINNFVRTGESIFWGATLKGGEKLIGGFCIWNLSHEHNKAEVGFGIYPIHQNKGYMSEILRAGLDYGFAQMQLDIIEAYTHPENAPSLKVLGKYGFKPKADQHQHDDSQYLALELYRNELL